MSLFDSASLVVTPNGVKEDKLYSIKPTNGSGDLVVTRATTATRVNSDGLIEQVPYNLATYSEDFSNVIWSKVATTITTNSVNAPNGTLTADTFIANGTTSAKLITGGFSVTLGTTYSISVFVKKNTNNFVQLIGASGTFGSNVWANFDLNNGVIGTIGSSATATITDFGNDWYRCVIVGTATASTTPAFSIGLITSATSARAESNTLSTSVYLWGAQLVTGTSAKEYFPTTDRLDVPRLDYTNSSCPSILVEPQRTNVVTYSNDLSQSIWSKTNYVLSSTTSIQGITATRVTKNATNNGVYNATGARNVINTVGTFASGVKTLSFLIRKGNTNKVALLINNVLVGAFTSVACEFNFNTKTFTNIPLGLTASFENPTTDVYKIILTINDIGVGTSKAIWIAPINDSNNTVDGGYLDFAYAQWELGSNATSYIPTVASSVTRNADIISKTGISSLIGQTEGTIFVDANLSVNANERRLLTISNGTETQRIIIWTLGTLLYTSFNNISVNLGNFPIGTTKIAIGYTISGGNTTYSIKVNNNALVTGTAAAAPNPLSAINLGSNTTSALQLNDRINSTLIWKERLSNTELAQLTTI
jgi:hypothetical protein